MRPRTDLRRARRSGRLLGDRGSSDALGLALLAPAMIGLAVVIVFLSRGVDSRATVRIAAESAAQAAAQERSPVEAVRAARAIGTGMLVDEATCASPSVAVDMSEFRPGGRVSVTVSCTVSGAGLGLVDPRVDGPTTATAFATIDPLRGLVGGP